MFFFICNASGWLKHLSFDFPDIHYKDRYLQKNEQQTKQTTT